MSEIAVEAAAVQGSIDALSEMVEVLFTELDIQRVLSVDDSWVHDEEGALEVSSKFFDFPDLLVEVVRLLQEHAGELIVDLDVENPQALSDFVMQEWEGLPEEFRTKSLDAARLSVVDEEAIANAEHGVSDAGVLVRLGDLLRPFVTLESMGHVEWRAMFDEVAATEVGALVLFDRDFSVEDGGTSTTGEDLVRDLVAQANPLVKIAMLTRSVENEDEELAETKRLESSLGVSAGNVVVIGKYRLKSLDEFPGALRVLLLAEQIEAYRELAKKALNAATTAAQEELERLQRYTIMGAIASAQREGVFELDPPLRLVRRIYERQLSVTVRDAAFATSSLHRLRSGAAVSYLNAGVAGPQLSSVLRADIFEDAEHLNQLGMPIEIGDIFETVWLLADGRATSRRYVLLSQSCDISVREKGIREPEITTLLLHEFRRVPKASAPDEVEVRRLKAVGPFEDDMETWGVNFLNPLPVPALAIDATVFSGSGDALIDTRYDESRPMAAGWVARHAVLVKKATGYIEEFRRLSGISKASGDMDAILNAIAAGVLGTSRSPKSGISGQIDVETGTVRYGLRRIGRMLPAVAAGVLANAAAYHARPAFDAPVAIDSTTLGH